MKKPLLFITLIVASLFTFSQEKITLTITNIRNSHGTIKWVIHKDASHFTTKSGYVDAGSKPARTGSIKISIDDIPDGNYAISIFHDENNNSNLDTNLVGLPKEGFGFSRNPKIYFGPPKYKECVFTKKGNNSQSIKVKYYL